MQQAAADSRERLIEIVATVLLALATVGTAWSGYQSARWDGVQADNYSRASAARVESTKTFTRAGQLTQVDIATFIAWVQAYSGKDAELERFLFQRFRPPMKRAVDAWIASRPLKNPDAAPTPFTLPQYRVPEQAEAERLETEAGSFTEEARQANQRSDNYVLAVVLFASSLFFAGISTKFELQTIRIVLLGLGVVVFIATAIWVATFPVTVSI
jgi:hypothetical protein